MSRADSTERLSHPAFEPLEPRTLLSGGHDSRRDDDRDDDDRPHRPDHSHGPDEVRFATFNASLNRSAAGQLVTDLSTPNNAQAKTVAEIIQRTNPDVLLINEFDYVPGGLAARLFQENYLSRSQNGARPIEYPYFFIAPSNTGIPSGFDLDNNGSVGGPNDAYGFGFFPGQFGMAVFSKYPILNDQVRTFQNFLWNDMPGAKLPDNPATPAPADWYSPEELNVFRLSSKSHWDIPVSVDGRVVHVLASHPTPPVFDGPEDRNGTRNHDEIRLFADYISRNPADSAYIYDDAGKRGGLPRDARFVIMGDQNSDPLDGDSIPGSIQQLLDHPRVNAGQTPDSLGAVEQSALQGGANATHRSNPRFDTADFADNAPGNLRADYVLPSSNIEIEDAGVFWPRSTDPLFRLVGTFNPALPGGFPSSDHRLVWVDAELRGRRDGPRADTLPQGVASGDVTQRSAILWARSTAFGKITFELSTSPDFRRATRLHAFVFDTDRPAKVFAGNLKPNTTYHYRATDAAGTTKSGAFKTAAPLGTRAGLTFGASGDWRGELLPYPSIANIPAAKLDLFLGIGDTVYADVPSPALRNPDGARKQQAMTLDDFRIKNAEVYSERFGVNFFEQVRASTPFLVTIDDHEVTNDFAGGAPPSSDPRFAGSSAKYINDTPLYENGLRAFQEYNPIRDDFYGRTGDDRTAFERKLYRASTHGSDAAFFILDARSFRDRELANVTNPTDPAQVGAFLVQSFDPARTMLGRVQVDDLKADLLKADKAGVTWKFVTVPEPIQNLGVVGAADRFEGYAAERTEILKFIDDHDIDNVVFIAADIHGTVVNNLTYQTAPGTPQIPTTAFEITTGAVAYDAPFGPTVANLAAAVGLLTPQQLAFYNSLPVNNDPDDLPDDRDDFIKGLVTSAIAPLGYDPVGLNRNLPAADGLIDATLLKGDYAATHTFGWTEFKIDPATQQLRVITWGIDPYTEAELLADPAAILARTPRIVSEFIVNPKAFTPAAPASPATHRPALAPSTSAFSSRTVDRDHDDDLFNIRSFDF